MKLHVQGDSKEEVVKIMKKVCAYCDGKGIIYVPNGEDDQDEEFCHCPVGQHAEHIVENEILAHGD